jgi:hypothetical protein
MGKRDAPSLWQFQAEKYAPKPSHQRPAPAPAALKKMGMNDRVTEVVRRRPQEEEILVEESTASDSMIMRIIGKIRGA